MPLPGDKENHFSSPVQTVDITIAAGVNKANMSFIKVFLLSVLAGAFIAFGAEASTLASHTVADVGLARFITGCVFPVGLMLIVIVGGELYTGNCLMVEAVCDRKIGIPAWMRNLLIVIVGNLVGSLLVVSLVMITGQLGYSDAVLGAKTIQIAVGKANLSWGASFVSGILCNILVCAAVIGAFAARDIAGKLAAIWFPVMAFVLSGFEHSVANMYYIPAGIAAAANPTYAAKAMELYGYSASQLASLDITSFLNNFIPVLLGNFVGGAALGLILWFAYKKLAR